MMLSARVLANIATLAAPILFPDSKCEEIYVAHGRQIINLQSVFMEKLSAFAPRASGAGLRAQNIAAWCISLRQPCRRCEIFQFASVLMDYRFVIDQYVPTIVFTLLFSLSAIVVGIRDMAVSCRESCCDSTLWRVLTCSILSRS